MRVQFKLATTPLSYYCSQKSYLTSLNDYQSLSLLSTLSLSLFSLCSYLSCFCFNVKILGNPILERHQTIDDIFKWHCGSNESRNATRNYLFILAHYMHPRVTLCRKLNGMKEIMFKTITQDKIACIHKYYSIRYSNKLNDSAIKIR